MRKGSYHPSYVRNGDLVDEKGQSLIKIEKYDMNESFIGKLYNELN